MAFMSKRDNIDFYRQQILSDYEQDISYLSFY